MIRTRGFTLLILVIFAASFLVSAQDNATQRYNFVAGEESYSFEYPTGWTAQDSTGLVVVYNGDAAMERMQSETLESGDAFMYVAISEILQFMWDEFDPVTKLGAWPAIVETNMSFVCRNDRCHSRDMTFSEPEPFEIPNGNHALFATGRDKASSIGVAYVIVEYAEGRFMLFFAQGLASELDKLEGYVKTSALSLQIGSDIILETATVSHVQTVQLAENIYPIAVIDNRIYTRDRCSECPNELTIFSAENGKEVGRISNPNLPAIAAIIPAESDNLWIVTISGIQNFGVSLLSTNGEILSTLNIGVSRTMPILRTNIDGNLYMLVTREIKPVATQPPHEVRRDETEVWLQIWNPSGELINQFKVYYEEYSSMSGGADALSLGSDGNIYVVDASTNKGIMVFQPNATLIQEGLGLGKVMFQTISGFDVLPDGSIWLGVSTGAFDEPSNSILHLNTDGELLGTFNAEALGLPDLYMPIHFTQDGASIKVVAMNYEAVQTFSLELQAASD
jgi:hypothetical protein